MLRLRYLPFLFLPVIWVGCSSGGGGGGGGGDDDDDTPPAPTIVGGVFAMTNGEGQPAANGDIAAPNAVAAYARADDGTLSFVGSFPTGGLGGDFDGGEGLDPLISANAVELTPDRTRLLAVNAGSNTITSFLRNEDMSLTFVSNMTTQGFGPNSIATDGERVFVTNIDADGEFEGEPDQVGNVVSFLIDAGGVLTTAGDPVLLENRPSNIRLTNDGNHIVISSLTAGSIELDDDSIVDENTELDGPDEIVVHPVQSDGTIDARSGSAISSFRAVRANNDVAFQATGAPTGEGGGEDGTDPVDVMNSPPGSFRNLPSPIGILVAPSTVENSELVIVTETREFNAFGGPPTLPDLEAGSISTFLVNITDGTITNVDSDVTANMGPGLGNGGDEANQLTFCWIAAVQNDDDSLTCYVSNTINSLISSFNVAGDGTVTLIEGIAAAGEGPFGPGEDNTTIESTADLSLGELVFGNTEGYIDMTLSDDNDYLYQLTGLAGTIEVFSRNSDNTLTLIQTVDAEVGGDEGAVPTQNSQGIVAF